MEFSVGIPSYNESLGILRLLRQLGSQRLWGHRLVKVIVSDDSTDETPQLVERYAVRAPYTLRLFHHGERRGVAEAWNEIFEEMEGEALVLYDADVSIEAETTQRLLDALSPPNVGIAASNTIPTHHVQSPAGSASALIGRWLRAMRLRHRGSQFTVMGRGLAASGELIRKIRIPPQVIAVDLYLQCAASRLGYQVKYVDEARVYFRSAESFRDFASQVVRAFIGHRQLRELIRASIKENVNLVHQLTALFSVARPGELAFTALAYALTFLYLPKILPGASRAAWEIASSTKC